MAAINKDTIFIVIQKNSNVASVQYALAYVLQIIAAYVPLTLFLITIMLLDINLAPGPLNTFVFFSQILPSLDLYAGGEIPIDNAAKPFVEFYQFCYGIFNLEYFESIDSVSIWYTFEYDSALTEVLHGYIVAFWPLVIISMVWLVIFISDHCNCGIERNVVWCIANCLHQLYQRLNPKGISLSNQRPCNIHIIVIHKVHFGNPDTVEASLLEWTWRRHS